MCREKMIFDPKGNSVRVILLDIDNTLLDFHACARASLIPAFESQGLPFLPTYMPIFEEVNGALWNEIEKGMMTREELYAVRFHRLFARLGLQGDGDEAERCFRAAIAESTEPVKGAHALLRYLYPKYMLCAASNSVHAQQVKRLHRAGMLPYFSYVFTSEQLGCAKPAPEFFARAHERLGGYAKEKLLLIGDSLTADIRGGVDYGIPTCWFAPGGEEAPTDPRPRMTVRSLAELHTLL